MPFLSKVTSVFTFFGTAFEREANCSVRNFKGSGFSTPSLEIHIAAESFSPKGDPKNVQSRGNVHPTSTPLETRPRGKEQNGSKPRSAIESLPLQRLTKQHDKKIKPFGLSPLDGKFPVTAAIQHHFSISQPSDQLIETSNTITKEAAERIC
jgi:hypothetical protein